MKEIDQKEIKLSDFPPKLQKLGQYLLDTHDHRPIRDICVDLGLSYDSIRGLKSACRTKRNKDFDLWLFNQRLRPLKAQAGQVYRAIVEGALAGKLGQQKLVVEMLGDIKHRAEVDHRVTGLFAVVSPSTTPGTLPADIVQIRAETKPEGQAQVIDIAYED